MRQAVSVKTVSRFRLLLIIATISLPFLVLLVSVRSEALGPLPQATPLPTASPPPKPLEPSEPKSSDTFIPLPETVLQPIESGTPELSRKSPPLSPTASTGTVALFTPNGSSAGTADGDYVSDANGLNTFYRFFIEVPSGLNRLVVEIFDADIGIGGVAEAAAGRDRDRNGFDTSVTYTLLDPTGATRATLTGNNTSPTGSDNAWLALFDTTTTPIIAGHWELRVDMGSGDDINAIGIRANDGTSGGGGTELNIYADSIVPVGVNPPDSGTNTRSYTLFPYLTSGCSCSKNDFDFDSDQGNTGSLNLTSRSGAFSHSFNSSSMSVNNTWRRDDISGWTTDSDSTDYGIWQAGLNISSYSDSNGQNGNYADFYMSNSQAAANPPLANPVSNSFRMYLPTDSGTAPSKPHLEQQVRYANLGPNPPAAGQTTTVTVTLRLVNPTAQAITFSATNLVTANIPGAGVLYDDTEQVSQGIVTAQPAVGGTGNITWNPGTLAAGATAILAYRVNVKPTSSGQRIPVTGTVASGNGTTAKFVDETGNTTQGRATFLFGPLCELAVTAGLVTAVDLASFTATTYEGGVLFQWNTGFEVDNLGFRLYRDNSGNRVTLTKDIIAGSALVVGGGIALGAGRSYQWWDEGLPAGPSDSYWLEEIDLRGHSKWHGPFSAKFAGGPLPKHNPALKLSDAGKSSTIDEIPTPLERRAKPPTSYAEPLPAAADLPSQPALKLGVRHEGWYRVTQPEMIAAGFDPGADPGLLQLFVDGQELPIEIVTGENGYFDASSSVQFYGMGLDSAETDARVYWLVTGSKPGLRLEKTGGGSWPSFAGSFSYTVERKDRSVFFFSLKNGDQENFFGATVSSEPTDQWLTVAHVDYLTNKRAGLEVAVQGATLTPHRVDVRLNGADLGAMSFDEQEDGVAKFDVPRGLLREGANQVTLTSLGGDSDIGFVDYIHISYWHTFWADNDTLRLMTPGGQPVTLDGFTESAIHIFDVTDPASIQELSGQVVKTKRGFRVALTPAGTGQRILIATTDRMMKRPDTFTLNYPSSLRNPKQAADLVIIAHQDFLAGIEPLKELRRAQGLAVTAVSPEDIYDEFSYGQKTPQAIRDFLAFAVTRWEGPPRFVLLVGNASRDPKNYFGFGDLDFVPTKTVDTASMETASDDWFVDFDGDGLPDIAIGRLPVRTPGQLSAEVSKIIAYEQSDSTKEVLLYADSKGDYDFAAANAKLESFLSSEVQATQINRDQMDAAAARSRLLAGIERGQKVVNYSGHGSETIWKDFVFTSDDADNLTNRSHLPLFVMMTCLNGYFVDPASSSLAESLMNNAQGGAIAAWASSGMTSPGEQAAMNQQLFQLLLSGASSSMTLGEATIRAKTATNDLDVRRSWILFGDPTTRLK